MTTLSHTPCAFISATKGTNAALNSPNLWRTRSPRPRGWRESASRARPFAQIPQGVGMGVEAPELDEEDIALDSPGIAAGDEPRHLLQLAADGRGRVRVFRGEGGLVNESAEELARGDALFESKSVLVGVRAIMDCPGDVLNDALHLVQVLHPRDAPLGVNDGDIRLEALRPYLIAVQREGHGPEVVGARRAQGVGHAAADALGGDAGRLALQRAGSDLLVEVRKQARAKRHILAHVLDSGCGLHQRAHVGHERELTGVVQLFCQAQLRMNTEEGAGLIGSGDAVELVT
mmetsp:Transcript_72939/g.211137  ORF Transcript_72939/g.211137 Transcript_72939/m.211137 type:complete len:289 (+) Transcript_72939:611-1477(+)